jgi:hypothetical protein
VISARRYALIALALGAGILAFLLASSVLRPPGVADHADYYCYSLRAAWVCAQTKSECEARLASERVVDVPSHCQARYDEVLTP